MSEKENKLRKILINTHSMIDLLGYTWYDKTKSPSISEVKTMMNNLKETIAKEDTKYVASARILLLNSDSTIDVYVKTGEIPKEVKTI